MLVVLSVNNAMMIIWTSKENKHQLMKPKLQLVIMLYAMEGPSVMQTLMESNVKMMIFHAKKQDKDVFMYKEVFLVQQKLRRVLPVFLDA